jgi:hypothetical protein
MGAGQKSKGFSVHPERIEGLSLVGKTESFDRLGLNGSKIRFERLKVSGTFELL